MKGIIQVLILGLFALPCFAKVYTLTENSNAKAEIIIAEKATVPAQTAALELQHHIKYITGATLPIVTKQTEGKLPIYVGDSPAVRKFGIDPTKMKIQQYTLAFRDNAIILAGKDNADYKKVRMTYHGINTVHAQNFPGFFDEQGSMYAVYDFLRDHCGVEWLDPSDAGTVIKPAKTLKITGKTVVREPFVNYRGIASMANYSPEMWDYRKDLKEWREFRRMTFALAYKGRSNSQANWLIFQQKRLFLTRMKAGGESRPANHSLYHFYERFLQTGHKNFESFKPHYFAQKTGRTYKKDEFILGTYDSSKRPPQLCYGHPETVAQIVKDIRDYFDNGGYRKKFSHISRVNAGYIWGKDTFCVEAMDNSGFCDCKLCKPDYEMHRKKEKSEHSTYWFKFINKVAREIKKSHPGKKISTLAYASREGLPTGVKLEDNVIVYFCISRNRMPYSKELKKQLDRMVEWRKAYPNQPLAMWLYNTFPYERTNVESGYHCFPGFFATETVRQYRFFKKLNVRAGIFHCGFKDDFENYLNLRLMVNPDLTLKELKDTYFASYGKAEKHIRAFYDLVEKRYCDPANYNGYDGHQTKFVAWGLLGTAPVMKQLAHHMEQAEKSADTPQAKARVALWKKGIWEYMLTGKRHVKELKNETKGVRVVRTEYNGGDPEDFGNSFLRGKTMKVFAPKCSLHLNGRLKKLKTETTDFTDGIFKTKGTLQGPPPQVLYYYEAPIRELTRMRVTLLRGNRVQAHFIPVVKVNGKWIALCGPVTQEFTTVWRKNSAEGAGVVTMDIYFDKSILPANAQGVGILERSRLEDWYFPEYIQFEAEGKIGE